MIGKSLHVWKTDFGLLIHLAVEFSTFEWFMIAYNICTPFEMQATKKGMRELKKQNVFLMKTSHKWINSSNFQERS